jgi:hexosaminidase
MYGLTTVLRSNLLLCLLIVVVHGFITWIAVRLPLEGTPAEPGAPWPLPQQWTTLPDMTTLNPNKLNLTSNLNNCDVIDKAFDRYRKLFILDAAGVLDPSLTTVVTELRINIEDERCDSGYYPTVKDNETYSVEVGASTTAIISANSIWGALRGLETFSQLIYLTDDKRYQLNQTTIVDYPRYSHRGLMIDTSRHFYPVTTIISILDAMSYDKFNVLHWHIVDDQSFPFESRTFPNLSYYGAYTPNHVYNRADVIAVLDAARLRGIRVIPEFDTPGHTWSWGKAFPGLITPCWGKGLPGGPYVPKYPSYGPAEILNPMLDSTYTFLDQLFREIAEDFPDEYIHLGMDEVYYSCWESNPNITEWMNVNGYTTYSEVEQHYEKRLIALVQNISNVKYVIWQDPVDKNVTVQSDTIVQLWKDDSNGMTGSWQHYARGVAEKGYTMILSSPWYLNYISYGQDWKDYYMIDPDNFTTDPNLMALMKGGEACAWSEYIDPTNVISLLWPRASAVAERLWSSKEANNVESAKFRLDQQRCRMVRRKLPAKPILNGYCGDYEWDMQATQIAPSAGNVAAESFWLWRGVVYVVMGAQIWARFGSVAF